MFFAPEKVEGLRNLPSPILLGTNATVATNQSSVHFEVLLLGLMAPHALPLRH